MNNILKHSILFFLSMVLVGSSVFASQKSYSDKGDMLVNYGYPLKFVEQNFYDNKNVAIYYQRFDLEREDTSFKFSVLNFCLSVFIVFLILELLIYILELVYLKIIILLGFR